MSKRYFCAHGHFYQPPRENPWLETIEVQDSAAPYHDWNERINRECYAPNTVSRALDEKGRIRKIVNNFKNISFNIGPTLFSWLENNDPLTYDRILVADRLSVNKRGGHGNAIAQAYNHMIMPLATDRDRLTQVRWGIADFEYRFGRAPEGMWLPETGACAKTLEVLADNGIKFTILSQSQAKAIKNVGQNSFTEIKGGIDPSRAYRAPLAGGKSIDLFFYDGAISRAVAFEKLLSTGEKFIGRLKGGFSSGRQWPQMLNIATDGETFGHHHRFGEMALTYAVDWFKVNDEARITNYGEFLELHPPQIDVEIHDHSSWSCAHGVERWKSDCGCAIDPDRGWSQAWRKPLREALDYLKEELDDAFDREGKLLFKNPWDARDRYIKVILDRSKADEFLKEELAAPPNADSTVRALKLLEMQRNSMLMYTSCGWFFDDVSGIETVQILKYSARAIQLLSEIASADAEERFIEILAEAKSNQPKFLDGKHIYQTLAAPERATLERAVATHSIAAAIIEDGKTPLGEGFEVKEEEKSNEVYGENSLSIVRAKAGSKTTLEKKSYMVVTLTLGKSDVTCFVKELNGGVSYPKASAELLAAWRKEPLTKVLRRIDTLFGDGQEAYQVRDLFTDTRRMAVAGMVNDHVERFAETYEKLFWENARVMDYFIDAGVPVPSELGMAAQYTLERELLAAADEIETADGIDRLTDRMGDVDKWSVNVDLGPVRKKMENNLCSMIELTVKTRNTKAIRPIVIALLGAQSAEMNLDLWEMQNHFADLFFAKSDNPSDPFYTSGEVRKLGIMLNFAYNNEYSK